MLAHTSWKSCPVISYMKLVAVAGGFVGLVAGADLLVRGGARAARTLGVSTLVIGMTIVAYGTSAPEMMASLVAAVYRHPEVTVGNVIGSNIANIGLILGFTALSAPFSVGFSSIRREVIFMLGVTLAFSALALRGGFGRGGGLVLLAALAAYNLVALRWARQEEPELRREIAAFEYEATAGKRPSLLRDLSLVVAGLALLIAGGHFLVTGAVDIAKAAGVSETVIGLTLVAVGTSLPELATSVVAALRGEIAISIGNVVGSNIFNLLGAVGVSAVVRPFRTDASLLRFELPALLLFTLAMAALLRTDRRIGRIQGVLLLGGYGAFLAAAFLGPH